MKRILKGLSWAAAVLVIPRALAGFGMTAATVVVSAVIIVAGVLRWILADEQRSDRTAQLLAAGRTSDRKQSGTGAEIPQLGKRARALPKP
jgi:hypothetical protein